MLATFSQRAGGEKSRKGCVPSPDKRNRLPLNITGATMQTYIRYDRNGKTSERPLTPATLIRIHSTEKGMKPRYASRVRTGKTAKDRANGCAERAYQRKRARDGWRDQTRSTVYSDPSLVPAFPR